MATGRPIGTIFAELDLAPDKFNKGLDRIKREAGVVTLDVEKNFQVLGLKSAQHFDLLRARAENAYQGIVRSAQSTANDRLRAEQALAQTLSKLQQDQFGGQMSMLDNLKSAFSSIAGSGIGAFASIGAAIAAVTVGIKSSIDAHQQLAVQVRDLTFLSGGTAQEVSGLVDVLDDYGIEVQTVERAMVFLSKAVQEGSPALERLNISIRDSSGSLKTAHELFYEVIDALRNTRSETERNALAQELFSRGWMAMVPVIEKGSAALREAAESSKLIMTAEDLKRADDYRQALANIGDALERIKLLVAREIIVPITIVLKGPAALLERLMDAEERGKRAAREAGRAGQREYFGADLDVADILSAQGQQWRKYKPVEIAGETPGEKKLREAREKAAKDEEERQKREQDALDKLRIKEGEESRKMLMAASDERLLQEGGPGFVVPSPGLPGGALTGGFEAVGRRGLADELSSELSEIDAMLRKAEEDYAYLGEERLAQIKEGIAREYALRLEDEQKKRAATQALIDYMREKYFEYDDTIREHQISSVESSEGEILEARLRGWERGIALAEKKLREAEENAESIRDEAIDRERERQQALRSEFEDLFGSIGDSVSTAIKGVIMGTQTMEEAFDNMAQNIALSLVNNIINRGLNLVGDAIGDLIFGAQSRSKSQPSASGGLLGGLFSIIGKFLGFQEGGIVPGPIGAPVPAILHAGEEVIPVDKREKGGSTQITQVFAPQVGIPEAVQRELRKLMPQIRSETVQAVLDARNRGGIVAKAVGSRR